MTVVDRIFDGLFGAGPLGLLCVILLVLLVGAGRVIQVLFGMIVRLQAERRDESLGWQKTTSDATIAVLACRAAIGEVHDAISELRGLILQSWK